MDSRPRGDPRTWEALRGGGTEGESQHGARHVRRVTLPLSNRLSPLRGQSPSGERRRRRCSYSGLLLSFLACLPFLPSLVIRLRAFPRALQQGLNAGAGRHAGIPPFKRRTPALQPPPLFVVPGLSKQGWEPVRPGPAEDKHSSSRTLLLHKGPGLQRRRGGAQSKHTVSSLVRTKVEGQLMDANWVRGRVCATLPVFPRSELDTGWRHADTPPTNAYSARQRCCDLALRGQRAVSPFTRPLGKAHGEARAALARQPCPLSSQSYLCNHTLHPNGAPESLACHPLQAAASVTPRQRPPPPPRINMTAPIHCQSATSERIAAEHRMA